MPYLRKIPLNLVRVPIIIYLNLLDVMILCNLLDSTNLINFMNLIRVPIIILRYIPQLRNIRVSGRVEGR